MASILCPHCKKDDSIQKLSSIFATVSFSESNSESAPFSGISIEDLDRLLRAPTPPKKPVASWRSLILSLSLLLVAYFVFLSPSWFLEFFLIVYIFEKIGRKFVEQYGGYIIFL